MREKLEKETIENAQLEIARAEMWIDFYGDFLKSVKDPVEKAKHEAKIEGIKKGMDFNRAVIKFLKK